MWPLYHHVHWFFWGRTQRRYLGISSLFLCPLLCLFLSLHFSSSLSLPLSLSVSFSVIFLPSFSLFYLSFCLSCDDWTRYSCTNFLFTLLLCILALFSVCGTDVSMEIAVLTQSLEKMLTLMTSISTDPLVTEVHFYIKQCRNWKYLCRGSWFFESYVV